MEDESIAPGVETSITDEIESDLDLVAGKTRGSDYMEQDS